VRILASTSPINYAATRTTYALSLHDALPISGTHKSWWECDTGIAYLVANNSAEGWKGNHLKIYDLSDPAKPVYIRDFGLLGQQRSEEHTSELQSRSELVCRLLLEKKNKPRSM